MSMSRTRVVMVKVLAKGPARRKNRRRSRRLRKRRLRAGKMHHLAAVLDTYLGTLVLLSMVLLAPTCFGWFGKSGVNHSRLTLLGWLITVDPGSLSQWFSLFQPLWPRVVMGYGGISYRPSLSVHLMVLRSTFCCVYSISLLSSLIRGDPDTLSGRVLPDL